jgi:hypothetical protein
MKKAAVTLILTLVSFFALVSPALACKCLSRVGGGHKISVTEQCCREAHGKMEGRDCSADSISNDLSAFAQCCAGKTKKSDSRCSAGC